MGGFLNPQQLAQKLGPLALMKTAQQATGNDPLIENPLSLGYLGRAIGLENFDDYNVKFDPQERSQFQDFGALLGMGAGKSGMGAGPGWIWPLIFHNAGGTMYDMLEGNRRGDIPFSAFLGEFLNQDPGMSLGAGLRWGGRQ